MFCGWGSGYNTGSRVLDQLVFMDRLVGYTREEGVAIINMGSDQGLYESCSAVGCE